MLLAICFLVLLFASIDYLALFVIIAYILPSLLSPYAITCPLLLRSIGLVSLDSTCAESVER